MSKLASIERIIDIQPIPGADAIEVCTVLGWQVVVKKGEFKVGDLVTYIQIDTVVPPVPHFEFLRERNFRVRTIKLRKQISQGLVIPKCRPDVKEGDDVTDIIGVKKYEKTVEVPDEIPPVPKAWHKRLVYKFKYKYLYNWFPSLRPISKKAFPTAEVRKTDEERIQNIKGWLDKYRHETFYVTEKLDGSSITVLMTPKGKFRVCSRNWEFVKPNNEWTRAFNESGLGEKLKRLAKDRGTTNIIVQGEYIGKPQGNKYGLKQNEIRVFNLFINGRQCTPAELDFECEQYGISTCPIIEAIHLNFTLESILAYAEGKSKLADIEREGVVFRKAGDSSISFKVISNKFLLKNEE